MLTEKGEGAPTAIETPSRSRKTGPQTNSYVSQRRSHGTSNVTVCRVPASQLPRKQSSARRMFFDSLRLLAAFTIALAIMVAADWLTQQARPVIVAVGGLIGLIAALMLIAHKELS